MAKKQRKNKELARLRREIEILRAQLPTQERKISKVSEPREAVSTTVHPTKQPKKQKRLQTTQQIDPKFLKADLIKSAILTLITLGILIALTRLL